MLYPYLQVSHFVWDILLGHGVYSAGFLTDKYAFMREGPGAESVYCPRKKPRENILIMAVLTMLVLTPQRSRVQRYPATWILTPQTDKVQSYSTIQILRVLVKKDNQDKPWTPFFHQYKCRSFQIRIKIYWNTKVTIFTQSIEGSIR